MVSSRAVRGLRATGATILTAGALPLMLLAGCGGGQRQDANAKSATYKVHVVSASFPRAQHLTEATELRLQIRNADTRTIPNLAVTIGGGPHAKAAAAFGSADPQAGLADSSRPVWILDQSPPDGETAYDGTWSLSHPLAPGRTASFVWKVTAVKAGHHVVSYRVAGGLTGKAKVKRSGGGPLHGAFTVDVSSTPPTTGVGPNGEVVTLPSSTP